MNHIVFTDRMGNPVEKWVQTLLNTHFDKLGFGIDERKFYDHLIHESEKQYENYNREICSDCKKADDPKVKENPYPFATKERGCCNGCAYNKGYYMYSGFSELMRKQTKRLYKSGYGYFDIENHKCTLPRHLRSSICLRYCCNQDYDFDRGNSYLVDAISDMREIHNREPIYVFKSVIRNYMGYKNFTGS